jgi:hypothetical protein
MPKKKNIPINYTSRDFESIKSDLIDHAKRYYSDVYRDFSVASFGSLTMDTVAYVGDILSFYLDYQANESFMDTAIEFDNVRRHAKNYGYTYTSNVNAFGTIALFIIVPSNSDGSAPDFSYLPTMQYGAAFESSDGKYYILTEQVDFSDANNDVVAARFDSSSGQTTHFAVRAYGQIVSGDIGVKEIDLTNESFQRFRRVRVGGIDVTGVISITDNEGNKYYEVPNLSQEVVYLETTNRNASNDGVRSILKPFVAARRFVLEQDDTGTYLQFGDGSEDDDQLTGLYDPSKVALKMHGKRNITSSSFDPTHMIKSGKLGISPSGKKLNVILKTNTVNRGSSAAANTITNVRINNIAFKNPTALDLATAQTVRQSLEVSNPDPVVGSNQELTKEELRQRAKAHYYTQNRAVTAIDYESLVYSMPPSLGTIRRCAMINDPSSTSRRLTLYVVSLGQAGELTTAHDTVKGNIKNYLQQYRSVNDIIDIVDAKIINFGIEFVVVSHPSHNSNDVMRLAIAELQDYFSDQLYIGEPIYISNLYNILSKTTGVIDVKKVNIVNKTGNPYSNHYLDFDDIISRDGTYIKAPKNVVFELKYPNLDIKGVIK